MTKKLSNLISEKIHRVTKAQIKFDKQKTHSVAKKLSNLINNKIRRVAKFQIKFNNLTSKFDNFQIKFDK
ncbi:MAG: hypothetical protein K5978_08400 [Campylobacter sp.]|nr:hypothetical protein [Campylobacter sp.]